MVLGSSPVAVTSPSDFAPASSKEFLDIQATIECGFTLKRVRDMTRTYSQGYKYFIGYKEDEIIRPLCIILPQMNGYIKYFENGRKNMSFLIKNKYEDIWDVIKNKIGIKFHSEPIYEKKY